MINHVELEFFRQHEHLRVEFSKGLNVLKAANEMGKTTIIESLSYALFGTRALRTSLDDAVTWGQETKKLKVVMSIKFDDKDYVFARSKSGAEVKVGDAVLVTGQTEVSNFAATMLGADINMASKLMFANQNGVRSAIDEGPKALSTMIENLAGMDVFDRILESAQEKLALGSAGLLEERLKGAQNTLSAALLNAPEKPDVKALTEQRDVLTEEQSALRRSLPDLQRNAVAADEKHGAAAELYLQKRELERALESASKRLADSEVECGRLGAIVAKEPDSSAINTLRKQVADADNHEATVKAWDVFASMPTGERYVGSAETFEADVADTAAGKKVVSTEIDSLNRKMIELKHKRINADTCDKCGQSILHLPHVQETNAHVDEMVAQLAPRLVELEGQLNGLRSLEEVFAATRKFAAATSAKVKALGAYVKWDDSYFPALPIWAGQEVSSEKPVAPRVELAKLEAEIDAWVKAKVKFDYASEQHKLVADAFVSASKAVDAFAAPTSDEILSLAAAARETSQAANVAEGRILLIDDAVKKLNDEFDVALRLWDSSHARIADAEKVIGQCRADLDSLGFNNALVKKLRAIRPLVADKIWNTVLTSTSVMFSQIRGEQSVITKDKDGFRCNGQAVESLSGSTLDALALALRVALIRTFIPQCELLVLDEVAAAMDQDRTIATLGFIQTVDMGQTILITHEVVSEQFANNIIEL